MRAMLAAQEVRYVKRLNLQVYQKVIIVFAALVIPMTAITIAVNMNAVSYLKAKILESTRDKVNYYRDQLNNQITFIRNQHLAFMTDANLEELSFKADALTKYEELLLIRRIQDRLQTMANSSEFVQDAAVYIESTGRVVSLGDGIRPFVPGSKWHAIRQIALAQKQPFYMHNGRMYFVETSKNETITTYIQIPQDHMLALSEKMIPKQGDNGFFLADDRFRSIISSSRRYDIESGIAQHMMQQKDGRWQEGSFRIAYNNMNYLIIYDRVNVLGCTLYTYIDEREITGVISKYNWLIGAAAAAALIIIVIFAMSVNQMIHKPLRHLIRAFRKIEMDPQQLTAASTFPNNEFTYLNHSFDRMRSELSASIQLNYEHKLLLQQSELRQLQSQINPHFLYNGFYNVYRMCRAEDVEGAAELSLKLATYYEFITRSGSDEVPLEREYEHAEVYCDIQRIRFARSVHIAIEPLPEAVAKLPVPRLIIQPIVENAFKHAFERERKRETCLLAVEYEAEEIAIRVEDSGKALTDDTIEALNKQFANPAAVTEKTGLINVCNRLQLRYGGKSCMKASRSRLGGLCIELLLPAHPEGGSEDVPYLDRR
ncbi:two-component sensor histidine kinase [Paenibacillus dendritiformis]|nr:two-component sensor histidine kinase [Paenibacillus dendritiformis]